MEQAPVDEVIEVAVQQRVRAGCTEDGREFKNAFAPRIRIGATHDE